MAEAVAQARSAYQRVMRAYNRGDAASYFDGFADPLRCFYGDADVPLARVRQRRRTEGTLAVAGMKLLAAREVDGARELVFVDRGFYSPAAGGERQVLHEKIVALREVEGDWEVVVETNRGGLECAGPLERLGTDARLRTCRGEHRACLGDAGDADARLVCERGAMRCLGLMPRPEQSDPAAVTVEGGDDLARFVDMALGDFAVSVGGGALEDLEWSEEEARWYRGAAANLGVGEHRTGWAEGVGCGPFLFPEASPMARGESALDALDCDDTGAHCVAWIRGPSWESDDERFTPLHLVRAEGKLVLTWLGEGLESRGDELLPLPEEAESAREAECSPLYEALREDRSEELWEVTGGADGFRIRRRCGDDAAAAVHALGDRWRCEGVRCDPVFLCGNYCEGVGGAVREGETTVFSAFSGVDARPVTEALAERLKERIACGESSDVPWETLYPES